MELNELYKVIPGRSDFPPLIGRDRYAGAGIIIPVVSAGTGLHLLFQQRAAHIPQGSEICFPGGEFDPLKDTSLLDTAIRETIEEIGVARESIEVIGIVGTVSTLRGIMVDCWLAVLHIGSVCEIRADTNEVARVFTLPVEWFLANEPQCYPVRVEMHPTVNNPERRNDTCFPARQLGLPRKYWKSWFVNDHEVFVYKTPEGVVWGMTALVVRELILRLREV